MNILKAIIAGISATAAMSIIAMFVAPMMGMPKMDFGTMLGSNNPMMPMPYAAGWMIHFVMGVIMAIVYAKFLYGKLPGNGILQGIIYGLILFILAQSMVMPMMGKGMFSGGDVQLIMGSMIGHIVFGATLGATYRRT